jgi:hypothetical protein
VNTLRKYHSTGARADEEPAADLGIGEAFDRQSGDLLLLRCQFVLGFSGSTCAR